MNASLLYPSVDRHKAFSSWTSHLTCATGFYSSLILDCGIPRTALAKQFDKAFFYTIPTSLLNPLMYSSRTRKVGYKWSFEKNGQESLDVHREPIDMLASFSLLRGSETSTAFAVSQKLAWKVGIWRKGHVPCGLICHPDREHILYPLGCTVVIQHLDTKKQSFLHGHADNVSCVVVSRDGMYVASGQVTCIGFKVVRPEFQSCLGLSKALDRVMVWDVSKREAVCGSPASPRSAGNANVVMCSSCRDEMFVTAGNFTIRVWELDTATKKIYPSECYAGQLRRITVCVQMTDDDGDFYLGTTSGDVLKVNTSSKVVTACGPQKKKFSMGVTALLLPKTGGLIVGTGEGTVALCTGSDFQVKK
ncbi:hypothetical protein Q9233_017238 [Columba guinea]|nr:hypothetical protein Q9233_017238 [Columba guinea]